MKRFGLFLCALGLAVGSQAPGASAQLAKMVVDGDDIRVPGYIASAVASSKRPMAEKDRDAGRKPGEVLAFLGIEEGDTVSELLTAGGYYTALLSEAVGPNGKVYAHNNDWFMQRQQDGSPIAKRIAEEGLTNVEEIIGELENPGLPRGQLDAVMIVLIYHDTNGAFNTDVAAMNKAVYDALKPGGVYGIIDHHAAPGAGMAATTSVHRIERHVVVDQITAAGFELAAETDLLENLDDPMTGSVFSPAIRGKSHRFVLKFQKPG